MTVDLFLDSGAFTAHTKGTKIDICEYTKFAEKHAPLINVISSLDHITSWKKSLSNLTISNLSVPTIPCFHYGEPFDLLQMYVNSFPYIALGGLIISGYTKFIPWLDECFGKYICDKNGYPKIKVHGFAVTSQKIMFRYPWYSVDSSTWLRVSRMGMILIPKKINNVYRFDMSPIRIQVSSKGPMKNQADFHLDHMARIEYRKVKKYVKERGFKFGKSKIVDGKETILKKGLRNSYSLRDKFNILYMLDLEKALPKWPSKFSQKEGYLL